MQPSRSRFSSAANSCSCSFQDCSIWSVTSCCCINHLTFASLKKEERLFSHTKDCETTDRLCEGIMLAIIKEGRRAMADPTNYEARANIMWAGMVAQNNLTGVGRAQDWGTHHMENELSSMYGCSHGAGLAVLFPYWMEYAMETQPLDRFVQFATRVWGCQMNFEDPAVTAREGITCFKNFMKEIGMPTTIGEIGGKP